MTNTSKRFHQLPQKRRCCAIWRSVSSIRNSASTVNDMAFCASDMYNYMRLSHLLYSRPDLWWSRAWQSPVFLGLVRLEIIVDLYRLSLVVSNALDQFQPLLSYPEDQYRFYLVVWNALNQSSPLLSHSGRMPCRLTSVLANIRTRTHARESYVYTQMYT